MILLDFDGYDGFPACFQELLGKFEAAERWEGLREGFIFKVGIKGLGYYEATGLVVKLIWV